MTFYCIDHLEIMGDLIEELMNDLAFEADMASCPYSNEEPTDEDMELMFLSVIARGLI